MANIGKISVIPKDFDGAFPTLETSLRKYGMSRAPRTFRIFFPFKELEGNYRTGLDPNASYILNIQDLDTRNEEIRKINARLEKIQKLFPKSDLSPTSDFWNHSSNLSVKVEAAKLQDGDNIFPLDNPTSAITFYWLSAHPLIASSLHAYLRGDYPPEVQFYVNDDDFENQIVYRKKKTINDAIIKFSSFDLEKRKKIARLMGIPISDDTIEEIVYNQVDEFLKKPEIEYGAYKGSNPITVFGMFADLEGQSLDTKDLIQQALNSNIYRIKKGGKVYEGELVIYNSKEEMFEHLMNDENQDEVLTLHKKLKIKKLSTV